MQSMYDVYEPGAADVWEGRIETPAVRYTVLSPDDARLRELILTISGPGNADAEIRAVGLARASRAADALVRRFQWDHRSRLAVVAALEAIGNADANTRLLEWFESASPQVRYQITSLNSFVSEAISTLVQTASGCAGAEMWAWGPYEARAAALRSLVMRCPQFAANHRAAIRAPDDATLSNARFEEVLNRRRSAFSMLGTLADPADVPLLVAVARGEEPALRLRSNRGRDAWADLERHAVYALKQMAWAHAGSVLRAHLPESIEGTPREIFLSDVRGAIERLPVERLQTIIPEWIAATPAAVVDTATTLRDLYVAQLPVKPAPPAAATSVATVREAVSMLSSNQTDAQIVALEFLIEHGNSSLSMQFADLVDSPDGRDPRACRRRDRAIWNAVGLPSPSQRARVGAVRCHASDRQSTAGADIQRRPPRPLGRRGGVGRLVEAQSRSHQASVGRTGHRRSAARSGELGLRCSESGRVPWRNCRNHPTA